MTQNQRVVKYINEFGSISTLEAFTDLGITRLASRICDLKNEGYKFKKEWESSKNRYDEPVSYVRYSFFDESEVQ